MQYLMLLMAAITYVNAGIVGDFSSTHNLPGYIDLDPKSRTYIGPYTRDVDYGDGVIKDTPSEIVSKYFVNDRIDINKIKTLISEIEKYRQNARIAYCQAKQAEDDLSQIGCHKGWPRKKLEKKWKKRDVNVALKYAILRLEESIPLSSSVTPESINKASSQNFLEALFDAYEIYQGVVQEDSQYGRYFGLGSALRPFREALKKSTIVKGRIEAANLYKTNDPNGEIFYSPEQLTQMSESGVDISLLDPMDSGFWRKPKFAISSYNTSNYHNQEMPYFRREMSDPQIQDLMDPKAPISVSYKIYVPKGTGETPKLYAKYGKSEYKIKLTTDRVGARKTTGVMHELMKIARDMEVNVETVTNNLAAAMGFVVDGTYYKDIVKVFFEDDVYNEGRFDSEYARMVEVLSTHYSKIYNTSSALQTVKIDPASGRKYIELKHVQLERKTDYDTDLNIGSFMRKSLGKSLRREHRAFSIFLAWVFDTNTKDANNALKLVPYQDANGKRRYHIAYSNSDMGSSLGSNRPNIYNFRLINRVDKDSDGNPTYMSFNYWRVFPLDIIDSVSFADAKWIARLMGQLTAEQIYKANRAAGFTDAIAKYYTKLMISKRNQLLESLNLIGTQVINAEGETVTLTKLEGFTGSIEGYEEFFENGYLVDPENKLTDPSIDPFPRYWGSGLHMSKGEHQVYFMKLLKLKLLTTAGNLVYNSFLSGTNISNQGIQFREMNLDSTSLANDCAQKCFFQGLNYGVEGFVPWRFIVENPDEKSEAPYLLVDMFRFGFFLGGSMQKYFGAMIPGQITLGLGAKHFQISEYMKIRPIYDIDMFFQDKSDLFKVTKLTFKGARTQLINSLEKDEAMIQTHYIGLKAQATVSSQLIGLGPLTPTATFRGNTLKANRVTYIGKGDSKIIVGWDKLKENFLRARINLVDFLFIQIPILEKTISMLKNTQRVFEFDLSNKDDKEILHNNLNKIIPSHVPDNYVLQSRTTQVNENSVSLGFLFLFNRTSSKRSIIVDYDDRASNFKASNLNYVREISKSRLTKLLGTHKSQYKVQSSINAEGEIYAKIKLEGAFQNMNKWKFKNLLYKYGSMLPENFIQFDPNSVLQNFGILDLKIETIFSQKALEKIFAKDHTKVSVCMTYAQTQNFNWSQKDCEYMDRFRFAIYALPRFINRGLDIDKKRFIKLWRKYEIARSEFWKISSIDHEKGSRRKIIKGLKSIVEMLRDTDDFDYGTMNLFLAMAEKDDYYRRASMYAFLEAFPGKQDYISEDVTVRGDLNPAHSMLSDTPQDEFELFTDSLHESIRHLFYDQVIRGQVYF